MRSGRFVKQVEGYRAFLPAPLPPTNPEIQFDRELIGLLDKAGQNIARLDGVASVLPDPNLFVAMYVRQEAVLSSQIEGTQSTLEDVLQFEIDANGEDRPKDVEEVVNYVRAMNYGLQRMKELPLSKRLIKGNTPSCCRAYAAATKTPASSDAPRTGSGLPVVTCPRRHSCHRR